MWHSLIPKCQKTEMKYGATFYGCHTSTLHSLIVIINLFVTIQSLEINQTRFYRVCSWETMKYATTSTSLYRLYMYSIPNIKNIKRTGVIDLEGPEQMYQKVVEVHDDSLRPLQTDSPVISRAPSIIIILYLNWNYEYLISYFQ